MLTIDVPETIWEKVGSWNGTSKQLIRIPPIHLEMEHSLLSISKWESKWKIPFVEHNNMTTEQFIDYCRQENAPLDFCSWHAYTASLDDITSSPAKVRRLLDERGFTETELYLDEWHYFNCAWDEVQGT